MTELDKLREKERALCQQLADNVNKRDAIGAKIDALRITYTKAIAASIATNLLLSDCRKVIGRIALATRLPNAD